MKRLLKFGYPAGVELLLNLLAFNAMILIFHSRGSATATAVTILFNWDMVSFVPLIGVGVGVTSLVGRYMGASNPDSAHRATMSGLKVGWVYSAFMLVLFVGFPELMVEVFRPGEPNEIFDNAVPIALFMMRTVAFYIMIEAVVIVCSSALRGAGDTFWAMCISVSLHWILVPVVYIMLNVFNASPQSAWVAVIGVFVVFTIFFYLRYRRGKWRTIKVIHHEEDDLIPPHEGFHETPDL
jgi:MATE family multidrug resistance protein